MPQLTLWPLRSSEGVRCCLQYRSLRWKRNKDPLLRNRKTAGQPNDVVDYRLGVVAPRESVHVAAHAGRMR